MSRLNKFLHTKSLKINAIFNAIYSVLSLLVPFITSPYISRVLGPENLGIQSYYSSIVNYFVLFASFGFATFGIQFISTAQTDKAERSKRFFSIMVAKSGFGLVTIAIYLCTIFPLFQSDKQALMLFSIFSLNIFAAAIDPVFYFQGKENFVSVSIRNMIVRIISVVLIFLLVKTENDLPAYVAINCGSQFVSAFILYFGLIRGEISFTKPNKNDLTFVTRKAFGYFIPTVAITLFTSLNATLLGLFGYKGDESGYYSQAINIIQILSTLIGSLTTIVLARFSYLIQMGNKEEIEREKEKIFHAFWVFSLPVCFGLIAIAANFVPDFFGLEFQKSTYLVYVMAPVIVLSALNGLYGDMYYRPAGKVWTQTICIFISSFGNIAICCCTIPFLKSYGAAIGKLSAEIIQIPLLVFFSRGHMNPKIIYIHMIKPLISSLLMFVGVFLYCTYIPFGNSTFLSWVETLTAILLGIIIYGVVEIALKDTFVIQTLRQSASKIKSVFCRKKINK